MELASKSIFNGFHLVLEKVVDLELPVTKFRALQLEGEGGGPDCYRLCQRQGKKSRQPYLVSNQTLTFTTQFLFVGWFFF